MVEDDWWNRWWFRWWWWWWRKRCEVGYVRHLYEIFAFLPSDSFKCSLKFIFNDIIFSLSWQIRMKMTSVKRSGSRAGLHLILKRPYKQGQTHPALLYVDADASIYQVRRLLSHLACNLIALVPFCSLFPFGALSLSIIGVGRGYSPVKGLTSICADERHMAC